MNNRSFNKEHRDYAPFAKAFSKTYSPVLLATSMPTTPKGLKAPVSLICDSLLGAVTDNYSTVPRGKERII